MNKKKIFLLAGLIVLLLFLIVGVALACVLIVGNPSVQEVEQIVPAYPPKETDPNQSPMEGDPGGEIETQAGQDAMNITYGEKAVADLSSGTVSFYYANPSRSNVDVVVSLVVADKVICQSQRITPGHQISKLAILDNARGVLQVGGYDAKFVVGCYDPETNAKDLIEVEGGGVYLEVVE